MQVTFNTKADGLMSLMYHMGKLIQSGGGGGGDEILIQKYVALIFCVHPFTNSLDDIVQTCNSGGIDSVSLN